MQSLDILKEAQKAVPAVKFALGVAGVAAAVALVFGLIKNPYVAVFGTVIMLGLMFILLVFSSIARHTKSQVTQTFAYVLMGFFVLIIMCTTLFLFTSVFFEYPRPINNIFSITTPQPTPTPKIAKTEAEFTSILRSKTNDWTNRVFTAQVDTGGIKESPSASPDRTQVWTTAQCLLGVLSSQTDFERYVPNIRAAFDFINNSRRTTPTEGWNLYGDRNPYTITEISSWVTLTHIKSLESRIKIWNDSERQEIINRIERDLAEIKLRQDANGGWRQIRDAHPEFTRTYSTAMAVWSLFEARNSPDVYRRIGNRYDENIRTGVNWLLRNYKPKQGWVPNPNRVGQSDHFDGLTAQVLFILSRAERAEGFSYIRNEQIYKAAEREFISNKHFANRSITTDNSRVPDPDVRFPGTEFVAEGSTFLWFPWTLAELTHLATDESLSPEDRKNAQQLRLEILNSNVDNFANYVESAELMYLLGENLYCVSVSTN